MIVEVDRHVKVIGKRIACIPARSSRPGYIHGEQQSQAARSAQSAGEDNVQTKSLSKADQNVPIIQAYLPLQPPHPTSSTLGPSPSTGNLSLNHLSVASVPFPKT